MLRNHTCGAIGLIAVIAGLHAAPAEAGTWSTRSEGGMSTHLYLPDAAGAVGAGRSLLVVLHGCTQSNNALKVRGNLEPAADAWGMVVAVPNVPNGGVGFGCWDYYGPNHSRTNRHNGNVLTLVAALVADGSLGVDPNQVYIAGLSSGGGQAAVLGCLAPDVFVGVGLNAAPSVGTTEAQFATVGTTASQAETVCRNLAGANAGELSSQVVSVITGTRDFIVAQGYTSINAQMHASLNGASAESTFDVGALPGFEPAGEGRLWSTAAGPRVSSIVVENMGHAFPAGSGDGFELEFVATEGPAWPEYLARFFAENNPRISGAPRPDAGVPAMDAGQTAHDAAVGQDGGVGETDSGAGGGGGGGGEASGCRCAGTALSPFGGAWGLLLLALAGSRRPRRARAPRRSGARG